MRTLGKALQVAGLITLPVACLLEISTGGIGRSGGLATMLVLMVAGVLLFVLGRFVEGYAGSP